MRFTDYDLIVFDVDGTLYFQNRLRLIMAGRLIGYYVLHPLKIMDLLIIKEFRSLRDKASDTNDLYSLTAKKTHVSAERVENTVKKWIYENPMDAVAKTADKELIDIIRQLKSQGKIIAIWSDYEADDKLKALGLECELVYTAEQERVGELKPSAKGLNLIMRDTGISVARTLMVGDRQEKDGQAAISAGCDYVILSKSPSARKTQLSNLQ